MGNVRWVMYGGMYGGSKLWVGTVGWYGGSVRWVGTVGLYDFKNVSLFNFDEILNFIFNFICYEKIVKQQVEQSKQEAIKDNVIVPKTQEEYCINSKNSKNNKNKDSRSQSIQSSSQLYEMDDMFDDEYYESYSEEDTESLDNK